MEYIFRLLYARWCDCILSFTFISWLKEEMHQPSYFSPHVPNLFLLLRHIPKKKKVRNDFTSNHILATDVIRPK